MSFESKIYGIETDILMDKEIFDFWYEKMPHYRKEKIDAMKPESGKRASLAAGILLAKGLDEYGIEGAEIGFKANGKPYIIGKEDFCFNLSHSGNMAVGVFSGSEVGVDVEQDKVFKENLINYVFDEREVRYICGIEAYEKERDRLYTRLWTMKESIMKYSGKGISMSPKNIFVNLEKGKEISYKGEKLKDLFLTSFEYKDHQISVCSGNGEFDGEMEVLEI